MSFDFIDMYKDKFKIVKWYRCYNCKRFEHLVCLRNKDMIVLKMWKSGEVSDNMIFPNPDENDIKRINDKVLSYINLGSGFEIKSREQVVDIMSVLGIDSDFVQ